MYWNQLIFSDERKYRVSRHLLFWGIWWIYFVILHAVNPFGKAEISYFRNPVFTFTEGSFFVLAQLPLAYSMWYIILPHCMLKKKFVLSIICTAMLWFLGGVWHWYLFLNVFPDIIAFILPPQYLENTQRPASASFVMAVMANYKGAFTITAFGFMIKFAKYWYHKEQRNLQLQKEKSEAQLQLLTAQIHPHFLFNTLNNIFSQTQTESPKGSKMIMALSDMLRYILYDGQKPLVPLKHEIEMIREYIHLEKIRYGNKLEVHINTPANTDDIYIAPLLLLPFVENCFKHGTSKMLQSPWINITISLNGQRMSMKIMNGKVAPARKEKTRGGIGIENVKQRLELLYKGKHQMDITEDEEVFIVDLEVELSRIPGKKQFITASKPAETNA
jgi:hypothetical protein